MGINSSTPNVNTIKSNKISFFVCGNLSKKEMKINKKNIKEDGKKQNKEEIKDFDNENIDKTLIFIEKNILLKEKENSDKKDLFQTKFIIPNNSNNNSTLKSSTKNSSNCILTTTKKIENKMAIIRIEPISDDNTNLNQNKLTNVEPLTSINKTISNEGEISDVRLVKTDIEILSKIPNETTIIKEKSETKQIFCPTYPYKNTINNKSINLNETSTDLAYYPKKSLSKDCKNKCNINQSIYTISEFFLLKVIGEGTFGKVFLAKNKRTANIYAIKCLKKREIIKNSETLKNLKYEKKILAQIDHPFITKLFSTFQDNEKVYLLMEYHNGGELYFHLQKASKFPENTSRFYAAQIYCALRYLHENGIIYRDLKPENIVLDCNGNIKIIDFGLAKEIDLNTNSFCGTNEYIPPETILGQSYSFNFDWWGFGVIIYEMLYGIPPFKIKNRNKKDLFKKICRDEPDYCLDDVSSSAIDLIKSLLKKDPCERIKPDEIPNHPFFSSIDFNELVNAKISPPIIPIVKDKMDTSYIDNLYIKKPISSPKNLNKDSVEKIDQSLFSYF